jgi:hypothetical protein
MFTQNLYLKNNQEVSKKWREWEKEIGKMDKLSTLSQWLLEERPLCNFYARIALRIWCGEFEYNRIFCHIRLSPHLVNCCHTEFNIDAQYRK